MQKICSSCKSVILSGNDGVFLDTTITFPLFIEGAMNEIRHAIQQERKRLGYDIDQRIILCTESAKQLNFDFIRKDVLADAVFESIHLGCESIIVVQPYEIEIGIAKYPYQK